MVRLESGYSCVYFVNQTLAPLPFCWQSTILVLQQVKDVIDVLNPSQYMYWNTINSQKTTPESGIFNMSKIYAVFSIIRDAWHKHVSKSQYSLLFQKSINNIVRKYNAAVQTIMSMV